ncbi:MAG: YcjF family protein [Burkholderiaceae bacterium]|jgi:hypothetical protein|nr:YcjF family protein [Burkholderiaceae bacterium]
MRKTIARALTVLGALLLLYAGASLVATFTQLAQAADRIHAGAGQPLFWTLLVLAAALLLYPLWLLLRLPRAMRPPADPAQMPAYRAWLQAHLAAHPLPAVQEPARQGDPDAALAALGVEAERMARETAAGVFVGTALIQNGRLDGLVVLGSQLRLVWRMAALYRLRPTPRQLWFLYSNVAGSLLVSGSLEELDYAEVVAPVISAAAPALAGAVPGMQGVSSLLVNSLANGAANALLTLRVGLITRAYCTPLSPPDAQAVGKSATLAAAGLLGSIVAEQGRRVVRSLWAGAAGLVADSVGSAADGVKRASSAGVQAVSQMAGSAIDGSGTLLRKSAIAVGDTVGDAKDSIVQAADKLGSAAQRWRKKDTDA